MKYAFSLSENNHAFVTFSVIPFPSFLNDPEHKKLFGINSPVILSLLRMNSTQTLITFYNDII